MKGTDPMVSDSDFGTNTMLFEVVRTVTNGADYTFTEHFVTINKFDGGIMK